MKNKELPLGVGRNYYNDYIITIKIKQNNIC